MKTCDIFIDMKPHVLSHLKVDVTSLDFAKKIKTSGNRQELLRVANRTLDKVKNIWNPSAIYCWCEFQLAESDTIGRIQNSNGFVDIDFGHSIQFLTNASHVLVSIYTVG
ncbi:MAG: hypothetical protein KAR45_05815, partial [Desulfobacteraceae bacterium]|nr:hypothetical protein [Desulfobacteraceae bacterium]